MSETNAAKITNCHGHAAPLRQSRVSSAPDPSAPDRAKTLRAYTDIPSDFLIKPSPSAGLSHRHPDGLWRTLRATATFKQFVPTTLRKSSAAIPAASA